MNYLSDTIGYDCSRYTYICVCEELCTMDLPPRKVLLFLAIETCDDM